MTEAEWIAALRTLPLHPAARGLLDDVALLDGGALLDAGTMVLTSDTLVEGVHFLGHDTPADVAWKLLATNLSDLAAKGAAVEGVMLNYPLRDDGWDRDFVEGFRAACVATGARLLGGDTVTLPAAAPRILTLTAIGSDARAPSRTDAHVNDALWVTGTIGDAGAGLAVARGAPGPAAFTGELLAAYHRPQPRLADGRALAPLVHAMMDVSDGLLIDAARLAAASKLAVRLDLAAVPLSPAYRAFAGETRAARLAAATAGDDYQLLFALPAGTTPPVPATCVGVLAEGRGLSLHDGDQPVPLPPRLGFEHAAAPTPLAPPVRTP